MKTHRILVAFVLGAALALPAEADTRSVLRSGSVPSLADVHAASNGIGSPMDPEAVRELICQLRFTDDLLFDLVRMFYAELGFEVIQNIDGFLEMIEDGCGVPIMYDPVRLTTVACEEYEKTRPMRNASSELARCARVAQLAQQLQTRKARRRLLFQTGQNRVDATWCNDLLNELAVLLGIRRDRLERLYGACGNSEKLSDKVELHPCAWEFSQYVLGILDLQDYEECTRRWIDSIGYPDGAVIFFERPDDQCWMRFGDSVAVDLCGKLEFDYPEPAQESLPGAGFGNGELLNWLEEWRNSVGRVHPNGVWELPYDGFGGFDAPGYGTDPNLPSPVGDRGHR